MIFPVDFCIFYTLFKYPPKPLPNYYEKFRGKKPSLSLFQTFKKPINNCDLIDESAFLKQCKLSVEKTFKMKI